ncbi:MAG TPA: polysaccharide deacetylase family protein [Acidobacteriaceae bacterium]
MPLLSHAPAAGVALGALGLAAGGCFYAGLWPTSQLFGPTLLAGADWREVALTFDDGPHERYTQELLEYLANYRVRATFFMIGDHVGRLPWLARRVFAAGHVVGNHTMTHPNLLYQSPARVARELDDCSHRLEDTLGAPVRYFRPPFGGRRPDVLRAARRLGLVPVLWNATGYDWRRTTPETIYDNLRRSIVRRRRAGRGSNLLLHDGAPGGYGDADRGATVTAVPMLIERLHRDGSRFVTVEAWDRPAEPSRPSSTMETST